MSIFIISRPLAGSLEPIKRPDPASIRKMLAKGGLKEITTFPGWLIDYCRFIIALPISKWIAWSSSINQLKTKRIVTYQDLSTLIGRLYQVFFIIRDARHFMSNLCQMETIARRKTKFNISRRTLDDLDLWIEFLESAKYVISINRVIF